MINLIKINRKVKINTVKDNCNIPTGIGYFESPIGLIKVSCNDQGINSLDFVYERDQIEIQNEIISNAINQLREYFKGIRKEFDLPVSITGTEFQLDVWEKLATVKYGETATYKDIAALVGNNKASRAIGGANNKNPIAIILPCHRIIGSNGKLVGYAGGLDKKLWLLEHEIKNI